MKALHIELENCYGIRKLKTTLSFSACPAVAIYAPNGAMKSSLARTFRDIAEKRASTDRIYPDRITIRSIKDDSGAELDSESVIVVEPYDEVLGHTEKTSTLLVNTTLRKEYEKLYTEIHDAKDRLIDGLKKQSGSKKDIAKEVSSTFTASDGEFFKAILRIYDEVSAQKDLPFSAVPYDLIFDEKAIAFLSTADFKTTINPYIRQYNELIAKSTYFKKGTFNYYNAATIARNLADNGFFDANHTISLNGVKATEIKSEAELTKLIAKEKEGISKDPKLREKFKNIEKLLLKNAGMRTFENYLSDHEELLPSLANMKSFQEEVWKSYLGTQIALLKEVVDKYRAAEKRKDEIEAQAQKERTDWEEVIEIFNGRFFVPFKLEATNRIPVMLGQEPILKLGFTFNDGGGEAAIDRAGLLEVLSTGEKKALYILNVIFDIQARLKAKEKTLVIVDDVADSFDYKNKYAIIQYLKEISDSSSFYQILLTHNFDFFRTVQSRFVSYRSCFMVTKNQDGINVSPAVGIKNIFVNDWKPNFATDLKKRIATIPFMRNLIEFTRGSEDPVYNQLTSLLHWKDDTEKLTNKMLVDAYNSIFGDKLTMKVGGETPVVDTIHQAAAECLVAPDGINFENKIVLSIAARLRAENFMIDKIADKKFVTEIVGNQTSALLKEYKRRFPDKLNEVSVISRVVLITPENIHLNSFMYEPILDMSDRHLRQLYQDLDALK